MGDFDRALPVILRFEGGYANNPADPGGPTMRGVTQRVYDRYRVERGLTPQPVRQIDMAEVADLYLHRYWEPVGAPHLAWPLSLLVFDCAVNCGVHRAQSMLQQTTDPGVYLAMREAFYRSIVRRRPASAQFLKGWLRRIAVLRRFVQVVVLPAQPGPVILP